MNDLADGAERAENIDMTQPTDKPELTWAMLTEPMTLEQMRKRWGMPLVRSEEHRREEREKNRRMRAFLDALAPKAMDDLARAHTGEAWGHSVSYTPEGSEPISVALIAKEEAELPPPKE